MNEEATKEAFINILKRQRAGRNGPYSGRTARPYFLFLTFKNVKNLKKEEISALRDRLNWIRGKRIQLWRNLQVQDSEESRALFERVKAEQAEAGRTYYRALKDSWVI